MKEHFNTNLLLVASLSTNTEDCTKTNLQILTWLSFQMLKLASSFVTCSYTKGDKPQSRMPKLTVIICPFLQFHPTVKSPDKTDSKS